MNKYSKETHPLLDTSEIDYWNMISEVLMSPAAKETLIALVERGPLRDGDIPSKQGRNELLQLSRLDSNDKRAINSPAIVKIMVNGEDGYQAATYLGRDLYKSLMLSDPDKSSTTEAKAARITKLVINAAKSVNQ